jgi:hypothetical protein
VLYGYTIEPLDDGHWNVRVEARVVPNYRLEYRIERLDDGRLDVRRSVRETGDPKKGILAVPFTIPVVRKDVDKKLLAKKNMLHAGDRLYNATVDGRMLLEGALTHADLGVEYEPVGFWLDHDQVAVGYFFQEREATEFLRLQEAYAAEAAGDPVGALAVLTREANDGEADAALKIAVDLYRARLEIDRGNLEGAKSDLERVLLAPECGPTEKSAARKLQGRVYLLEGDARQAFKLLHRQGAWSWRMEPQDALALAIAATQLGETKVLEETLAYARRARLDLGPLQEP